MLTLVLVLWVLDVILPTAGFVRLLGRSHRAVKRTEQKVAERGHDRQTAREFDETYEGSILERPRRDRRDAVIDTALVGSGLLCGFVANVLSLQLAGAPATA